jgi:hypothetical protein
MYMEFVLAKRKEFPPFSFPGAKKDVSSMQTADFSKVNCN